MRAALLCAAVPAAHGLSHADYMRQFGKVYGADEQARRARVFADNVARIDAHNARAGATWSMAVNEYADWSNEEFRALRTGARPRGGGAPPPGSLRTREVADTVDWRAKAGVLTAVKDQGGCGSCWAFSAVETYESYTALSTGKAAPVLSPQQVVSCAPNPDSCGGTGGCQGSTQQLAFKYLEGPGLTTEKAYPYKGATGTCDTAKIAPAATNTGYVSIPTNDYGAHVAQLNNGPLAITVAAGGFGWQLYGGGIMTNEKDFTLDHGVQLVGYGADGANMYWIVRNSWGAGWGEKGYIRLARYGDGKEPCGQDKKPADGIACKGNSTVVTYCGTCGMLSSSSYPTGVKAA